MGQRLGTIGGKLMEDQGYFSKSVCTDSSQPQILVSSDENILPGPGSTFLMRNSMTCFEVALPSAQNDQYAKAVYFGVIPSDLLHCP